MTAFDAIVGYTYKADNYCPGCIMKVLDTGEDGEFDGWALADDVRMDVEDNLDEIAAHFTIDRNDEYSFDTDYFPKVIFRHQVEDDRCGSCGGELT